MQRRNSALNVSYFGLLLLGLLLSAISRRIEPLCVVLPLAIALVYSRLAFADPDFKKAVIKSKAPWEYIDYGGVKECEKYYGLNTCR